MVTTSKKTKPQKVVISTIWKNKAPSCNCVSKGSRKFLNRPFLHKIWVFFLLIKCSTSNVILPMEYISRPFKPYILPLDYIQIFNFQKNWYLTFTSFWTGSHGALTFLWWPIALKCTNSIETYKNLRMWNSWQYKQV